MSAGDTPGDPLPAPEDVERALREAWARDTSDDPDGWSEANRALGQCAVSALVVRAIYGGDIVIATVLDRDGNPTPDGHAWNVLPSGEALDFTLEQFRDGERLAPPIVTEPVIDGDPHRAHLLADRLSDALGLRIALPEDPARAGGASARLPVMPDDAVPDSDSATIDAIVDGLEDWRGATLARVRELIKQAEPGVVEEIKWRKPSSPLGVPVWSRDGIICTGETYKDKVKLTFAKGASLADEAGLFNGSLDGKVRRTIDLAEGEEIDAEAFMALVREAAAHNAASRS